MSTWKRSVCGMAAVFSAAAISAHAQTQTCLQDGAPLSIKGRASMELVTKADGTTFEVWVLKPTRPLCIARSMTRSHRATVTRLQVDGRPPPPAGVLIELTGTLRTDNYTQYHVVPDLIEVVSARRLQTLPGQAAAIYQEPRMATAPPTDSTAAVATTKLPVSDDYASSGMARPALLLSMLIGAAVLARWFFKPMRPLVIGPPRIATRAVRAAERPPARFMARWQLKYVDGKGGLTKRTVRIERVDPGLEHIDGWCELRGARRTFAFGGVRQIVDADTGEVVDLRVWLAESRSRAP